MSTLFSKAIQFGWKKHKGQKYNGGNFFVNHPCAVFSILDMIVPEDENLLIAALLHDTLEDTMTSYDELLEEFGSDVANLVLEVTKDKYNSFPNLKTQRGVMLKFADRLANISQMDEWDDEKKQKYMFEKSKFWK